MQKEDVLCQTLNLEGLVETQKSEGKQHITDKRLIRDIKSIVLNKITRLEMKITIMQ